MSRPDHPSSGTFAADQPTPEELSALFDSLSNWGRWDEGDDRGALALITDAHRAAAAALVRSGRTVSLAHDLPVQPSAETPNPAQHHMLRSGDAIDTTGVPGYEACHDFVGTPVHGMGVTHIDALCHMFVRGRMFNGLGPEQVLSTGALRNTIREAAEGIVGRGVLLDIAAARGVDHLEGAEHVRIVDLEAAEDAAELRVGEGDLLLVGTGRDHRRRAQSAGLDPLRQGLAGLHPECLRWLHERGVAVLGCDGISDVLPGEGIEGWPFPIHQVAITAMGLHLIDNLRLDALADACRDHGRWEFLLTIASLRIPGGTGSPVNPLAIF
jgi:kynurenine formamidase